MKPTRTPLARLPHGAALIICFALLAALPVAAQYRKGPEQLPPRTVVARILPSGVLERSVDGGRSWELVEGMPTRVLPAYRAGEPLPVTAFAAPAMSPDDPAARRAIASSPGIKRPGYHVVGPGAPALAAVGGRLFVSTDGLSSWEPVDTGELMSPSVYITALAVDPQDPAHWLMGTSYDGLYRTQDAGATWTDLTADRTVWPTYKGAGFFEEISGIWFTAYEHVVVRLGFGQGFLRMELDPLQVTRLGPLRDGPASYEVLEDAVGAGAWSPGAAEGAAERDPAAREPGGGALDAAARRAIAADKTGIYLAARNAVPEKLPDYFDTMERHGFNSVVVDFKDDEGHITYDTSLEMPREAGAVMPTVEPEELVASAHERGIYVIARIVVFKDPKLWAYDDHRYALWDGRVERPWGVFRTYTNEESGESRTVQVEHWVDGYSPDVWQYVIDIAREVASFGVDEIQFDYIRFPSDGLTEDIEHRYYVAGADRVQALEGFLAAAREAIDIPISVDVFGFNAWARMSYLGQDITRLARYVDVISPMFYPSHFARSFLPQFTYLERAAIIYDVGTRRARELANTYAAAPASPLANPEEGGNVGPDTGRAGTYRGGTYRGAGATLIRPYLQAFLIGAELEYERPTYTRYLELQVEASERARSSGYTLWNASGRYYMLP